MLKLRIPIRMAGPLPGFPVRLQAVALWCCRMSATLRALIGYPWRHNSSASFAVLLDDQRNGDIGSPRVAGSTSRSNSFTSPGSCSAFDFLPPPALRTRSGGTSLPSSSRTALCSVVRLNPVARANDAIPPWPRNRASAAATNRRCRSFRYGFRRACFAPNSESSATTVSYILPARMSSLFLPGYLGRRRWPVCRLGL
jgi:hypothetical protein